MIIILIVIIVTMNIVITAELGRAQDVMGRGEPAPGGFGAVPGVGPAFPTHAVEGGGGLEPSFERGILALRRSRCTVDIRYLWLEGS